MKFLIRKNKNDKGYTTPASGITNFYFPMIAPKTRELGFIDCVESRPYQSVRELLATRLAIDLLDMNEEFVIKTREDYDRFVLTVNDCFALADTGAVTQIGTRNINE